MTYFVVCLFDLENADSDDYRGAYEALERIGLHRAVVSSQNKRVVAPTTTTLGEFTGASAQVIRDDVRELVRSSFQALRLTSEIFVVVAGDWAWGATTT